MQVQLSTKLHDNPCIAASNAPAGTHKKHTTTPRPGVAFEVGYLDVCMM